MTTDAVDSAKRIGQARSLVLTQAASVHKATPIPKLVIRQADEEDVIVEQGDRQQWQNRKSADQRPIEHHDARYDEREHRDQKNLTGQVNIHEPGKRRHDSVHRQIGDHLPIQLVKHGQLLIARQVCDHVHPRQVIHVVGQRRQRMRPDRYRDQQCERHRQRQDLRN